MQRINKASKRLIIKHTLIKPPEASTSKQKLERCHTSVLYWFFRNEEVCEAASLREGKRLWEGGANGNARGCRGYDKYLLRQTGREGQEERQSAKVESFNYIWGWVITFLILLTVRSVSVFTPSFWINIVTVFLLATSWQTWSLLCKDISYQSLIWQTEGLFRKGIIIAWGQCYTLLYFTMS